jgi:hypothetical protein
MRGTLIAALALCALAPAAAGAKPLPRAIALPDGWQPAGIASGRGATFYAGSAGDGAVYRGSYRTGRAAVRVPPQPGRSAAGLKYDRGGRRLFVAGGSSGRLYVYDALTGADVRVYDVPDAGFVDDVALTRDAAYFTDANVPRLYRVPTAPDGTLGELEILPLSGDIASGPGFDADGIEATRDGGRLIIVQGTTGRLFRADPQTGFTREIALDRPVRNGDGLLLAGRTLFVARNQDDRVAVVRLSARLERGAVQRKLRDTRFDVPTNLADFAGALYAVNARRGDIIRVAP